MTSIQRHSRIVVLESWYEVVKLFRTTSFIVPTLTFPIVFYFFFAVAMGGRGVGMPTMGTYLVATYGAFGVIGAALSAFGVSIAIERGHGWLQLKHATPMPLYSYLLAKLAAAVLISSVVVLSLVIVGTSFGGARIDAHQVAILFLTLVTGTIPFALLGVTIGYVASPQAALAVLNLVYLPMGFLSGLWIPVEFLPNTVQQIAKLLPAFHLGQLALAAIDLPVRGATGSHMTALFGFTLLFLATATAAYTLDRRRNYA
jgi:ABC-2 type transport system permease protein